MSKNGFLFKKKFFLICFYLFFEVILEAQDSQALEARNTQLNKAFEGTEYYNSSTIEKIDTFTLAARLSSIPHEWGYFDCYSFQSPMTIQMDNYIIKDLINNCPEQLKNDIRNLEYTTIHEIPHDHYLYQNTINHILLTGPSGSGKTSLALAMACTISRDFLLLPAGSLSREFNHSPLSIVNNLFYPALESERPAIIIFDAIPALMDMTSADYDPILIDHFCTKLDLCKKNPNLLIVLIAKDTTNLPLPIKERFAGTTYTMPELTPSRREIILKHYFSELCKIEPKLVKKLAQETEGFSLRELNLFIKKALNNFFSKTLEKGYQVKATISFNEIRSALDMIKQNKNTQTTANTRKLYTCAKPLALGLIAFLAGYYIHGHLNY